MEFVGGIDADTHVAIGADVEQVLSSTPHIIANQQQGSVGVARAGIVHNQSEATLAIRTIDLDIRAVVALIHLQTETGGRMESWVDLQLIPTRRGRADAHVVGKISAAQKIAGVTFRTGSLADNAKGQTAGRRRISVNASAIGR